MMNYNPQPDSDRFHKTRSASSDFYSNNRRVPGAFFSIYAVLFLVGCYVNIPYAQVPMISALPFALVGAFIFRRRLIGKQFLGALGIAFGVFLLSMAAPDLSSFFGARLLAFSQFLYSIFISLTLYWTVTMFDRRQVALFCKGALIAFLVGGVVEITTSLSVVMDELLASLYSLGDYIEIVNNRDVGLGLGFRRPKFFTSETSYYAMAYCVLVCVFAWLSSERHRFAYAFAFGVLGVLLARSPIPVLSLIFVSLLAVFEGEGRRRGALGTKLLIGSLAAVPILVIGYLLLSSLFETRLQTIASGDDYSLIYRTYGSLFAALASLGETPLFGVGIGSIDLAFKPLTDTYIALGVPASAVFYEWRFQVQNLPSALAIYLGLVGTTFYIMSLRAYIRFLVGPLRWPFIFLILMLSATEAAFYSPRFNVYLFLFLAVGRLGMIRSSPSYRGGLASGREV